MRGARFAVAVALAAATAVARAAPEDGLERAVEELEARAAALDARFAAPRALPANRAAAAFAAGDARLRAGDLDAASALLQEALDGPGLAAADRPRALDELGEALYRSGRCAAALPRLRAAVELPTPGGAEASLRALDCLVRLGRHAEVPPLLARARALHGGALPPDARYLAAKSAFRRRDVVPGEREAAALAALDGLPAPYQLAAAYLRGALRVETGALAAASDEFARCAALHAEGAREAEVRELCLLGRARVAGALGRPAEALEAYGRVPRDSPRAEEALYESAWIHLRAGRRELALRAAAAVAQLAPESPEGAEAMLLEGHVALALDRDADAVDAYNRVVNRYGPVLEELDAVLGMGRAPEGWADELAPAAGGDAARALPALAVRWAGAQPGVARALAAAASLEETRRDLEAARAAGAGLEAALGRAWGLGAFPELEEGYARADGVGNAAAALEGAVTAEEARLHRAPSAIPGYAAASAARHLLDPRVAALPRSEADLAARVARRQSRLAGVEAAVAALASTSRASSDAVAGIERWLARHAGGAPRTARPRAIAGELRALRRAIARDDAELLTLGDELAQARAAVGRGIATAADDALLVEYRFAVAREAELLAGARAELAPAARDRAQRCVAMRERLADVASRADAAKRRILAAARAGAATVRGELASERVRIEEEARAVAALEAEARELVGRAGLGALQEVRGQLARVVRKADAGIADVAWTRKRRRVQRIQELSARRARALEELDRLASRAPGAAP